MQLPLNLLLHQRTALVTLDTARAALGLDADSVVAMIDSGTLRWVWDIANHGPKSPVCEYRLWARELILLADRGSSSSSSSSSCSNHTIDQVITYVIGTDRARLLRSEVSRLLLCSRVHIKELVDRSALDPDPAGLKTHIQRAGLVKFLKARLIGAAPLKSAI